MKAVAVTAHAVVDDHLGYLRFVKHARRADSATALQAASKAIVAHWTAGPARLLGIAAGSCTDPDEVIAAAETVPACSLSLTLHVARNGAVGVTAERTDAGMHAGPETDPVVLARAEALVVAHILQCGLQWRHWSPRVVDPAYPALEAAR